MKKNISNPTWDKICSSVNSAKTVIVGNSGSGKSSLLKLVANKKFDENISPSQEGFVETETISYKIVGNKVKNVIYDLTGDPEKAPLIEGMIFKNLDQGMGGCRDQIVMFSPVGPV